MCNIRFGKLIIDMVEGVRVIYSGNTQNCKSSPMFPNESPFVLPDSVGFIFAFYKGGIKVSI